MILRSRDALRRVESQFHKIRKKRMETFSQELSSSLPEEAEISQGSSNLVNSPDDHESQENHETSNSDQRNFSNK